MPTTVLTSCAGCGAIIEVELPEDGSDETPILADSICDGCWEFMWADPTP